MRRIFLLLFFVSLTAHAQSWQWENHWQHKGYRDSINSALRVIVKGNNGNRYVLSDLYYSSPDSSKSCLAAYAPDGTYLWMNYYSFQVKGLAVSPSDELYAIADLTDTLIINSSLLIPQSSFDMLMLRLDQGGNIYQYRTIGTFGYEGANGICFEGNNLLLSGTFTDTLYIDNDTLPSNGSSAGFILRMDSQFNLLGKYVFDCTSCGMGPIAFDGDSSLYILGQYSGYLIFPDSGQAGSQIVLLKLSTSFVPLNRTSINGWTGGPYSYNFKLDHGGNVILYEMLQYTSSGIGNTITKLDPALNFMWTCTRFAYPLSLIDTRIGFDIDQQDNIYFCGNKDYYTSPEKISYIGKFNSMGILQWLMKDSVKVALNYGISTKANDEFFITGPHKDSTHIGPFNFYGTGDFLAFYGFPAAGTYTEETTNPGNFRLYPNPNKGYFVLESGPGKTELELYNVFGQQILRIQVEPGKKNIQLPEILPGLYVAVIHNTGKTFSKKILIE